MVMLISVLSIACSNQQKVVYDNEDTVSVFIFNATIIDIYTGAEAVRDILIREGRIIDIQPQGILNNSQRLKNVISIDASGQYAIPGLWDMHVHMNYILELSDDWMAPLFIAYGVTNVRDMGGEFDRILTLQQQLKQPGVVAPKLWFAGPVIDGSPAVFDGRGEFMKQFPTMPKVPVDTPEAAIAFVDRLAATGVHFIKPYEMLRPDVFSAMVKRAHHHGLLVDGHVPQRMTISEAIAAGMDGIVHMKGVDYGCARDPQALKAERVSILNQMDEHASGGTAWMKVLGVAVPKAMAQQDPDRCDALIKLFVNNGTWHTPGISTEAFLATLADGNNLAQWHDATQAMPAVARARKSAQYDQLMGGHEERAKLVQHMVDKYGWKQQLIKKMHHAGVKLLAGTDTPALLPPGFSLHHELEILVKAGLSPLAALQTATINPARFFNVENEQGAIEIGKVADIVFLNANPLDDINNTSAINTVIARGQIFDRAALDALMSQYTNAK
jgi:imidazolonepropionase-like amidohydrolase